MIPKTLQIKNFLSYGPEQQIIDFSTYNLICLSGKNGHGKSALLDAITWALWGQARKTSGTSKADEGLVHLGQKHMLVTLDFEINGTHYRVRREFVKTNSTPFSALDFGIIKSDSSFTTLTDKTIKLTQEKIEKTIGITFESFANSAFLRQGQANEFSKKSPKERKEILATILQLERFEDLKKAALEKTKQLQQQVLTQQNICQRIEQEIQELTIFLQEKPNVDAQLQTLELREQQINQEIHHAEQTKYTLLENHKKYEFLLVQKQQATQEYEQLKAESSSLEKMYELIAEQQKASVNIEQLEDDQKRLRVLVTLHQEKLNKRLELKDQYLTLQEKKQSLEKDITQAQAQQEQHFTLHSKILQEQQNQQRQIITTHEKKIAAIHQEIQILHVLIAQQQVHLQEQLKRLETYAVHEKSFEDHKNEYQKHKAQLSMLEQQLKELEKKQTLNSYNEDPSCPLCEQNLSASRKKFLEQKFQQEHAQLNQAISFTQKELNILHKTLSDEHTLLAQYKQEQELCTQVNSKLALHEQNLKNLTIQQTQLIQEQQQAHQKLQEYEQAQRIIQQEYEQTLKKTTLNETELAYRILIEKIEVLKKTAQALAYHKEEHDKDYQQLQIVEQTLQRYQELQKEVTQQDHRLHAIQQLNVKMTSLFQNLAAFEKDIQSLQDITKKIEEHKVLEQNLKHTLQAIFTEKSALLNKKAVFDVQTKKVVQLSEEQQALNKTVHTLHNEILDYTEISKALGKDGLQALLIEQSLPEIEQEANILLAQLTDNQTQIFIESLRDLKKGGSKETLDIKISDAIGIRPYEMFSGGEAFRIDFALRIAISKLLARRAGTALQTLIIDEGFGSQDEDGLQLIMDSILKIQDNFAKIIIVSHLAGMKEQFPVQFLVQKKASGSIITIIHQG